MFIQKVDTNVSGYFWHEALNPGGNASNIDL
jgi:hypothetical protein